MRKRQMTDPVEMDGRVLMLIEQRNAALDAAVLRVGQLFRELEAAKKRVAELEQELNK